MGCVCVGGGGGSRFLRILYVGDNDFVRCFSTKSVQPPVPLPLDIKYERSFINWQDKINEPGSNWSGFDFGNGDS